MTLAAFVILLSLTLLGYVLNMRTASAIRGGGARLHSLAGFHGLFSALLVLVPVLVLILLWLAFEGVIIDAIVMASLPPGTLDGMGIGQIQLTLAEIKSVASGRVFGTPEDWKLAAAERLVWMNDMSGWFLLIVVATGSIAILLYARRQVAADFRARQRVERIISGLMIFCATVAIFTTVGIVFALTFETIKFFSMVPVTDFLFGTSWEPQIPIREDQIAAAGAFGAVPVFLGTIVIATVALTIAVPVGLLTAIYLNEFAPHGFRQVVKPILEILAGVPTVVYGFFAILTVADDDRGDGGRPDRANDDQPAGQRHRRHGADRDPADRGYVIRQPQDVVRLRTWHGAFHRHALHQRAGPADRPQIPRNLRLRLRRHD
ncbi:MAG: phosphate ABC transporter permease family protein [Loktanella sp.]|nr:phosphate ABC transporter permease family protein [Loktanella sp.]